MQSTPAPLSAFTSAFLGRLATSSHLLSISLYGLSVPTLTTTVGNQRAVSMPAMPMAAAAPPAPLEADAAPTSCSRAPLAAHTSSAPVRARWSGGAADVGSTSPSGSASDMAANGRFPDVEAIRQSRDTALTRVPRAHCSVMDHSTALGTCLRAHTTRNECNNLRKSIDRHSPAANVGRSQ